MGGDQRIGQLISESMLAGAAELARGRSGGAELWRRPFAQRQSTAAVAAGSVWFTAYPGAMVTQPDQTVLSALGEERLWELFAELGIAAVHTGPMKDAGSVTVAGGAGPTIDGHFDRIGFGIDPQFGSETEYRQMIARARAHGALIIGDIIPGHTGKGPDFRLAELGVGEYPGLFHMVAIDPEDWGLLPAVPVGADSVNLSPEAVTRVAQAGYIVGALPRVIFYEPGIKDSNWSATDVVRGADGTERRWVYLHIFKEGQPALNWSDPSFAAARLVVGDCLHALGELGVGMLRLDANGFLGVERDPNGGPAISEGHPLSVTANQLIAGMVRKLGGFSFQELNLTLDDLQAMSAGGADLSYDFVSRPACHHALATGDAWFLRLMLGLQREHGIAPGSMVHALQNHDELTCELVHFHRAHAHDHFEVAGRQMTGEQIRDRARAELFAELTGDAAPYHLLTDNGVASTSASIAAACLGIRDLATITADQRAQVRELHLLLAFFNAMQPGVFALSGWDLIGALPLAASSVADRMTEGDFRWINRGAYDLLGTSDRDRAASGLPRAVALYGSLPDQLRDRDSFVARLRRVLAARKKYRIAEGELLDLPATEAAGLVVLVHELPDRLGRQVTAINFGADPIAEEIAVAGMADPVDILDPTRAVRWSAEAGLSLTLAGREGRAFVSTR